MRVVVYHSKHFDWAPVPPDVVLTEADKRSDRVLPGRQGGTWLMKVTRELDTHTVITISESNIVHTLLHSDVRGMKLTRHQAIALHITRYVLPRHTKPQWITSVEVHDDGPDADCIRSLLAPHVGESLDANDVTAHVAAYLESTGTTPGSHSESLATHLRTHWKIATPAKAVA